MKRQTLYFSARRKEIRERLIMDNGLAFAFPSNIPIVPGHILICPKRKVSTIWGLRKDELEAMLGIMERLEPAMRKSLGATGFNYAWNEGKSAGQNVRHLHIHMIPRKKGDAGITRYEPRKFLYRPGSREPTPQKELISISGLIRRNL
jgi:diadenosine tetraphosphate (Ap4A) HIT family hydrolase